MFESKTEILENGRVLKCILSQQGKQLEYAQVLHLWKDDALFRDFFINLLVNMPFTAYRWETPMLNSKQIHPFFEFVVVDSPSLERDVEKESFKDVIFQADNVIAFPNLGNDALLIVPTAKSEPLAIYTHLASFIRGAPEAQKHDIWKCAGQTMLEHLSEKPVWLSTAGGGVAWLHIRLDDRPKYYAFQGYKNI